jgi:predicted CXXCH cytochrome family protein
LYNFNDAPDCPRRDKLAPRGGHLSSTPKNALRHALAAAAFGAAALCCWAGCSPERDYRTLSLFFDGVPDPHAKAATQNSVTVGVSKSGQAGKSTRVIASVHKPFAEEKCTACHADPTQVFASALSSDLCMRCHGPVMAEHPAMHGPVVGKACLWCHEAHDSSFPSLLKATEASLCLQCHERATLSTKVEAHHATSGSCLDCHYGHGGDRPPFLRVGATSRPAAAEGADAGKTPGPQ